VKASVDSPRAISDDATICHVQDILVRPSCQGSCAGRALLEAVQSRYRHVPQTVLITDNESGQRAFYQALGFTEGSDFSPEPLRMLARFRKPRCSPGHGRCRAASFESEVVVALGLLVGVDVGWWFEPGDAGCDVDGPVFFVDEVVVMGAEQGAVGGAGGSAV
jgi:hypothetical protein